jgi:hypothetical protein
MTVSSMKCDDQGPRVGAIIGFRYVEREATSGIRIFIHADMIQAHDDSRRWLRIEFINPFMHWGLQKKTIDRRKVSA